MNSDDLKKHMQPHFEIFEGLDVYFWIAGGAIKDFFIGKNLKDYDFFFTKKIRIPVNKENIKVAEGDSILDYLDINLNTSQLEKKDLMILDLIESNDWERPIYFAITIGSSARSFLFLNDYFRLDGMVYKLMPVDYGQKTNDD